MIPAHRNRRRWYDCGVKKFAITVTDYQANAIERIRQQRGVPRSRVIQQALDLYLASRAAGEEADAAYEPGYRNRPEPADEADAYRRLAGEFPTPEEWG